MIEKALVATEVEAEDEAGAEVLVEEKEVALLDKEEASASVVNGKGSLIVTAAMTERKNV